MDTGKAFEGIIRYEWKLTVDGGFPVFESKEGVSLGHIRSKLSYY